MSTNFETADSLVKDYKTARKELHKFFRPIIKDYIQFQQTRDVIGNNWADLPLDTEEYMFDVSSHNTYYFDYPYPDEEGEGYVGLPHEFVENPDLYKKRIQQEDATRKAANEIHRQKDLENKRNSLFLQLTNIQRELAELDEQETK